MQLELTTATVPCGYCACGCGQRTRLAPQTARSKGWVRGEPLRFISGHNIKAASAAAAQNRTLSLEEYREKNCGYETPCWVWQRSKNHRGYGQVRNANGENRGAHRVYYERHNGPVPEGMQLDHLCRNRACVNPDHLEPVTPAENKRRGTGVKLDADSVRAIRVSSDDYREVAARYGITPNHVHRIRGGREWSDI